MDECTVRMTAIKVIVDLLMFHGSSPFIVVEEENKLNKSDEDLFEEEENSQKVRNVLTKLQIQGVLDMRRFSFTSLQNCYPNLVIRH